MQQNGDVFAQIAAKRLQQRNEELMEPSPPSLAPISLPVQPGSKQAFIPPSKRDSAAQLARDLETLREKYLPFLQSCAPKLDDHRLRHFLATFDWRPESDSDRRNFTGVVEGKGEWQRVSIPHYGPPVGRAATLYRTTFRPSQEMLNAGSLHIHFKGVDYKAHLYINHAYVGSHEGFFAPFEFDITPYVHTGENVIVVRVENDFIFMGNRSETGKVMEGDKNYAATGCGWDDPDFGWHHCPPGMGIYQKVYIEARPRLFIGDVFVRPIPEKKEARISVSLHNTDTDYEQFSFRLSLYGENFKSCVVKDFIFQPQSIDVPGLGDVQKDGNKELILSAGPGENEYIIPIAIKEMRQWEPENPWLYQLQITLLDQNANPIDAVLQVFGMRSFEMDSAREPQGQFSLNQIPVKLRGVNTMGHLQQCVMNEDWHQLVDDILLAKLCHVNFLRFTQRPVQAEIYDFCDRLGMMTQTDLPLFGVVRRNRVWEVIRQVEEMEKLIRSHPCNVLVSYINEPFPNAMGRPHRHLSRPELEAFFRAADIAILKNNPDRVIKPVDGDYDPPAPGLPDNHCYCGWYIGHGIDLGKLHKGYWQKVKPGWLYGCGEFGSEGLDSEEVMRKYYPKTWLPESLTHPRQWTPDNIVKAQSGWFHYMWYETPEDLNGWIKASQAHQEWITRLMTEAFRRDNRMVSFALHLLIDAFPAGWMKAVMDVDRRPKPAYFAFRHALVPLMTSLRSDRHAFFSGEEIIVEAWVCNDLHRVPQDARLCYQMQAGKEIIASGTVAAKVKPFQSTFQGFIHFHAPRINHRKKVIIRLALVTDKVLHHTFLELDLFEKGEPISRAVRLIGDPDGKAAALIGALGYTAIDDGSVKQTDVIVIDDWKVYMEMKEKIDRAVTGGAVALFIELPSGVYHINGDEIEIQKAGMGPRHFVSRNTNHALVRDFQLHDFKFWYERKSGYPTPLLSSVFNAPGWQAVLTSGNGDWYGDWKPVLAAAEKRKGKGAYRICQVHLADHIEGNPAAEIFARRFLSRESLHNS